jgi:hypothetical protein
LNVLLADDDDGTLSNGTPHMAAISAAFDRHGISCNTLIVQNGGCAGGPTLAPTLKAGGRDRGAELVWSAVPGAVRYDVYRSEGVAGCGQGKARIGQTTATSYLDEGLLNGFDYRYAVMAVGSTDACRGPMSACSTVTPLPGPNLGNTGEPTVLLAAGDGDFFLDNCEIARSAFTVENTGNTTLTNLRILSATPLDGPSAEFPLAFPQPFAASLPICDRAEGHVVFKPSALPPGSTAEMLVTYTADQISPETRTVLLRYELT